MTSRATTSKRAVSPRVARLLRARVSDGSLLCFDLDGPLLDVSERYWRVHVSAAGLDVAASHGRARYLALKRRGATDEEICRRLRIQVAASEYSARRRALLEQAEYLAFDRVWKWTGRVLTILHQAYRIAIVTKRQNAQTYRVQLLATGLRRLVDAEACEADVEGHAGDKGALIRRAERLREGSSARRRHGARHPDCSQHGTDRDRSELRPARPTPVVASPSGRVIG